MTVMELQMPTVRRTPYASMNVTVSSRELLQRVTLNHSAREGRRLSMSAVLVAALKVAEAHPDEFAAALRAPEDSKGGGES